MTRPLPSTVQTPPVFEMLQALIPKHVPTKEQIPQRITNAMLAAGIEPKGFPVAVNVILLTGGQFMEPPGLLVIAAPLVLPVAIEFGSDPIHLGIIMVVNMEVGMITPPVVLNLFEMSGITGMPLMRAKRAALPFLAMLFLFLVIATYFSLLSTFPPTTLMGPGIITF